MVPILRTSRTRTTRCRARSRLHGPLALGLNELIGGCKFLQALKPVLNFPCTAWHAISRLRGPQLCLLNLFHQAKRPRTNIIFGGASSIRSTTICIPCSKNRSAKANIGCRIEIVKIASCFIAYAKTKPWGRVDDAERAHMAFRALCNLDFLVLPKLQMCSY